MMKQWNGFVNVPIDRNWKCETCNERHDLIWGLVSGHCRCSYCHTEYDLMDDNMRLMSVPKSLIRDEYKLPIAKKFNSLKKPLSFWSEEDWDSIVCEEWHENNNI